MDSLAEDDTVSIAQRTAQHRHEDGSAESSRLASWTPSSVKSGA
jgi:hypothetical protein